MKLLIQFACMSGLVLGIFGCTSNAGREPNASMHHSVRNSDKIELPAGTLLKVELVDPLRSDTSLPGDAFLASIAEPVVVNGVAVLDNQTLIWGRVVDSVKSDRKKGSASLQLTLTDITESDRTTPIVTNVFTAGARIPRTDNLAAAPKGIYFVPFVRGKTTAPVGTLTTAASDSNIILGSREREVYFGPDTRINFTLLSPVKL